jgi:two-component system, response regulator PdtaR
VTIIDLNLRSERIVTFVPLRILVAEDNALIGMLLEEMLTTMGHAVCAVEATETGTIASALRYRPDLLIADGALREGSGINAVEAILRSYFVAYIFVTGDHTSIRLRMPDAVILEKPFNEASLEVAIRKVLQIADAKQAPRHETTGRKQGRPC